MDELQIRIRSMEFPEMQMIIYHNTSIQQLKQRISTHISVPANRQRLLNQGQVLRDHETLQSANIEDNSVLHLIILPSTDPNNVQEIVRYAVETTQRNMSERRRQRYLRNSEENNMKRNESIRQNLLTMEGLFQASQPDKAVGFNFQRRQFHIGQWVDVKDTVDQWLEAEISEMQEEHVFVHYNGWPAYWDEWISISSPRILPLHTHTLQSLNSPMNSPHPVVAPDAQQSENDQDDVDNMQFFLATYSIIERTKSLLESYV